MVDLIELPIDTMEMAEDTPFLAHYFPNIFAEALVPINPRRWPAFAAGSAMASEMPEFGDKIQTPFNNLIVTKEYLETLQSDVQYRDRIWQVIQDTFSCEMGEDLGLFGASALSSYFLEPFKFTKSTFSENLNTGEFGFTITINNS